MSRTTDAAGLTREAVVAAALEMLDAGGAEGLSMRALADRLRVKAASLYWHLRDKDQLLELLAAAAVDRVRVPVTGASWRAQVETACDDLATELGAHRARAATVLASIPGVGRSEFVRDIGRLLAAAGWQDAHGVAVALAVDVAATALVGPSGGAGAPTGESLTLAIASGSFRVTIRAGALGMAEVARSAGGGGAASVERLDDGVVVVGSRRGGNRGAVELSPAARWGFKVHSGTWNTTLDLTGLEVTGVDIDSGSGNVACILPAPRGVVPVKVNSGIVGVALRHPRDTAVRVVVDPGSVQVKLGGRSLRAVSAPVAWATPGGEAAPDRYDVHVHSGCVKVSLDATAPPDPVHPTSPIRSAGVAGGYATSIVALILDGIERRLESR